MSFCFLFSVVQILQLGFKRTNKTSLNQCLSARRAKNKEMPYRYVVMYIDGTCLARKETRRLLGFCRTRTEVGELFLLLLNLEV